MAKVTTSELENMIRVKIQEKGLGADITNDKIKEIKETIKSKVMGKPSAGTSSQEEVVVDVPTETPGSIPPAVTSTTSSNPEAVETAKKEGELEQKEKDISDREAQLANRQAELQRKQDELTYQPQIPSVLENIGPEKVFIFDQNEMSLGAEALGKTTFRLISNPDQKKSLNDLWLESGIRKAEVYIVKFERLGDATFDPFRGTAVFEERRPESSDVSKWGTSSVAEPSGINTPGQSNVPADGLTPEQARQSQEPTQPMEDAIEPVKDATLPMSDDMGLSSTDVRSVIEKKVEDILRNYLVKKGI